MKYLMSFFAVIIGSNVKAQTNNSELPAPLTCYHYKYNDRAGVRDRSNLSATPVMKIVAANFKSPAPSRQKVLIMALDEQGNVTATDQALASLILTSANSSHGIIDETLSITVIEVRGKVIHKNLTFYYAKAMDSNYKIFGYWTSAGYEDEISCFENGILPK